jgi:glycosyltransferase involved in cell wall biosynthesis
MEKISVIIITKDEEKNIAECISTVQWADEIIVVDAESTDNTIALAKKYTNRVFVRKWEGYVPQKQYALSLATNEWILSLDADERVTSELKDEIKGIKTDEFDGYNIRRKNFLFNKEIKSCGWDNDYQLRLFKKDSASLTDRLVHEGFTVDGRTNKLKAPMLHHTFSTFTSYLSKINHYTSLKAKELYKSKRKVNGWTIFSHTISAFIQFFILRRGFRDGVYGLIISLLHSVSTMLNYIKLWELQIKNRL